MPICERPTSVLEPPNPEIVPVESTEMKMTAFMMCAKGITPAWRYMMTNGLALVPLPPKISSFIGLTLMVIIRLPMM
jgi:hypothetical protein